MNGAVGLIGSEDNPANLMYLGVVVVAVIATLIARFEARAMSVAMSVTACAQALVPVIALLIWRPGVATPDEFLGVFKVFVLNSFFVVLWIGSAILFRRASRLGQPNPGNHPHNSPAHSQES
jgi:hypothetical protein